MFIFHTNKQVNGYCIFPSQVLVYWLLIRSVLRTGEHIDSVQKKWPPKLLQKKKFIYDTECSFRSCHVGIYQLFSLFVSLVGTSILEIISLIYPSLESSPHI